MPRRGSKGSRQLAKELIAVPKEEIGFVCGCASCREALNTAEEILTSGKFGCIQHAAAVSISMWAITQAVLVNNYNATGYELHELVNKMTAAASQYGFDRDWIDRHIAKPNKVKEPQKGKIV